MRTDLSEALEECLGRMCKGESIEDCLNDFPHLRYQLEPLLSTALSISTAPKVSPSEEFRKVSQARLMTRLREESRQADVSTQRRAPAQPSALATACRGLLQALGKPRALAVPVTLLLLIAMGGSIFTIVSLALPSQPTALAAQCTVSVLSGGVQVQVPGADSWQEAVDGMILDAGSRVRTATDSHALLTFFEGSSIKLEPSTDVEIQQLEQVDERSADIVLKQWLGTTWSRVVKRLDPGVRYEIQTPSAQALVRGTLFETAIDETAQTTVRTTEGLVSVSGQNEEVFLPAGQEAIVEYGASPSEPRPIAPADSELLITAGMPAVASICDPTGSSTGYLPDGFSFNQITGAQSTSPSAGVQIITIPNPVSGEYSAVLRCIGDGTSQFNITYLSEGKSVFTHARAYEITDGSEWLVPVKLEVSDGQLVSATVCDIEPLGDRAPEKLVRTDIVEASLVPIETPENSGQTVDNERGYPLAVVSSTGGSVTDPGQGVFLYCSGTVVDLVAEPEEGWVFEGWTGNVADASSPLTTITMAQAEAVTATFVTQQ
jgi:hypothetical protein